MRIKGTDCVGCAECIGCGRNRYYYYHVCDRCERPEQLYRYENEELCAECLLEEFEQVEEE